MSSETDVVIVGAGAAGIAAGVRLAQAGLGTVILEARGRAGGRAWTDETTFPGVPFDRGCHWLHEAAANPYRTIADGLGFAYDDNFSFDSRTYFLDGRRATDDEVDGIGDAFEEAYGRAAAAAAEGRDCAAAEVLDLSAPWHAFVDLYIGLDTSATPDQLSVSDMSAGVQIGDDFPVEAGFGALVAAHGRDLHITLSTPVSSIDWSGKGVAVDTPRGAIRARAAIVTASTSVLAGGGIRFTPSLPHETMGAIDACPLGCHEKIAFLLDRPLEEFSSCHTVGVDRTKDGRHRAVSLYLNPFGRPLALAHFGGSYAEDLVREGEAAMTAFALDALADAAGSSVRARVRGSTVTGWRTDPFVRGAYSAALPGTAGCREVLGRPVGDRVFLAGEAVSTDAYASCHGAHVSGIVAAEKALAVLAMTEPA